VINPVILKCTVEGRGACFVCQGSELFLGESKSEEMRTSVVACSHPFLLIYIVMSEGQSEKREARSNLQKARSDKVACRRLALLAVVQSERRLFTGIVHWPAVSWTL
jgi:hypothetical protein